MEGIDMPTSDSCLYFSGAALMRLLDRVVSTQML